MPLFFGTDYNVKLEVRVSIYPWNVLTDRCSGTPELRFTRLPAQVRSRDGWGLCQVKARSYLLPLEDELDRFIVTKDTTATL